MKLNSVEDLNRYKEILRNKNNKSKKIVVRICSTGCRAFGALEVLDTFLKEIKKRRLNDKVEIRQTGCHGLCAKAPVLAIDPLGLFYQQVTPIDVPNIISHTILKGKILDKLVYKDLKTGESYPYIKDIPFYKEQLKIVLRNCGIIDPTSIEQYIMRDGYQALIKVLTSMKPEEVIEEVKNSGLRGRGGAGFPTGRKWEFVRNSKGRPKYIVCNADEGDPGAFMDRAVLEGDPHSVLEGMLIAAYAIGANEGYVYVRAEYPIAVYNLKIAIDKMYRIGLLGDNILSTGFNFKLYIKEGAGAFVCGEETALLASIEGRRGTPRPRPPFPAEKGLFGKPTNINNVETYANIAPIILKGAKWYSSLGTKGSCGTKVFSLAGKVRNTGLVEVPMGITLRRIIFDIGGGISRDRKFKAVQTGGPSGGCIPEKYLDLPVDYESLSSKGAIMGSGGMIVTDEDTCMVDLAKFFLNFLRDESCGKCVPCRIGTQRMYEILDKITKGKGTREDIDLLYMLAESVKDSSLCGLGQTSANPILSTLNYFKDEYIYHIDYKKCPAGVCEELITSPCRDTCPINDDAQGYIDFIKRGDIDGALAVVRKTNPLPSVCGRACYHPCERKCKRGEIDKPVSIRLLKRYIADKGKWIPLKVKLTKDKVAVIGSGPAGLSCAYFLVQKGYKVEIFESLPVSGGMLAVGIPSYRLPKDILKRDIDVIKKMGVRIHLNKRIGKEIKIFELRKEFKALFLGIGCHKPLMLNIPGENKEGVITGIEFLRKVNLGKKIDLKGKKVLVFGGGNVAIDVARVSLRLKADEVNILYRRGPDEMPASKEEIEEALEEKINIMYFIAPLEVIGDKKVTGVKCIKMELGDFDESGRRKPIPVKGSEHIVPCDVVIIAISQVPDFEMLNLPKEIVVGNKIIVDRDTMVTSIAGIFAGGDLVRGPSTIVDAMSDGKRGAISIDKFLRGEEVKFVPEKLKLDRLYKLEEEVVNWDRIDVKKLKLKTRACSFEEIEEGFSDKEALLESQRCLQCDKNRYEIK